MDDFKVDDQTESAQMFKKQKLKILEVEVKIPDLIPEIVLSEKYDHKKMMFYQECLKYNTLIQSLKNKIRNLIKCLDGETLLDITTENEFNDLV